MTNLGQKKNEAHQWFDKLWKNHEERDQYYIRLAKELGLSYEECHFSLMNEKQLNQAIAIVKKWWWEKYDI